MRQKTRAELQTELAQLKQELAKKESELNTARAVIENLKKHIRILEEDRDRKDRK